MKMESFSSESPAVENTISPEIRENVAKLWEKYGDKIKILAKFAAGAGLATLAYTLGNLSYDDFQLIGDLEGMGADPVKMLKAIGEGVGAFFSGGAAFAVVAPEVKQGAQNVLGEYKY